MELEHLYNTLLKVGNIGRTDTGITRLGFSDEYFEAAGVLKDMLNDCTDCVFMDAVGNVHALLHGEEDNSKEIIIGSHLDTVKNGGLYDGLLGVAAGVQFLKTLKQSQKRLRHSLRLIAFNAEESGPLGGTFGSRVLTKAVDTDNAAASDVLRRLSIDSNTLKNNQLEAENSLCFLELHIEQGGILEKKRKDIGIVTGICGIRRFNITVIGESNHAGTTEMASRHDSLVDAAKLIVFINENAKKYEENLVATVGEIYAHPNLASVIPGRVELTMEVRSTNSTLMDKFTNEIRQFFLSFEKTTVQIRTAITKEPTLLSCEIIDAIENVCVKQCVSFMKMQSGAGHDAKSFADLMPTGMIFIPSVGGKSHSPDEYSTEEQINKGFFVFRDTILWLDCNHS